MFIEFHADDYGQTLMQCREILECYERGVLNGVSIMPCSPCLPAAMELLHRVEREDRPILCTVHLDLIEGKALSGNAVPSLTNKKGELSCRFGQLLLCSFLPWRRGRVRQEVKTELRAQIARCLPWLGDGIIRLDGHAHYHMLPVVFDALMDVIEEDRLSVSSIRFPEENIALYWRHRKEIDPIRPVNLIKVLLLNFLSRHNRRKHAAALASIEQSTFMGVMLSGHMLEKNIRALLPDAVKSAESTGRNLQLLFHPGGVYDEQSLAAVNSPADRVFFSSANRRKEKEALLHLTGWGGAAALQTNRQEAGHP